jgi:hypothetical protein
MANPRLPPEMLDHVVDQLYGTEDALKNCCLVSRSWIPRTRKHLFADVGIFTAESLESWKETFPDPSTSPGRYTITLTVGCPRSVTAADAEAGGWIRGFSRVELLEVTAHTFDPDFKQSAAPLIPFHGFSSTIKSLRVVVPHLPTSQIFSLIFSFPLLRDLAVIFYDEESADNEDDSGADEMPVIAQSPSPRIFTGTLELSMDEGVGHFIRLLLSRPGGIHFQKLKLTCGCDEDLFMATALVEECSNTLESLNISWDLLGMSIQQPPPVPIA